jgi:hypothetical protein
VIERDPGLKIAGSTGNVGKNASSSRRIASALGLCLAVVGSLALGAQNTLDGIYVGKRVLTNGGAGLNYPVEDDVSVTIKDETLTFTNSTLKDFTMPFYPDQDGSFGQIHTGGGGTDVHYSGRVIGDIIEADVTNPPCEYHWHLKKTN